MGARSCWQLKKRLGGSFWRAQSGWGAVSGQTEAVGRANCLFKVGKATHLLFSWTSDHSPGLSTHRLVTRTAPGPGAPGTSSSVFNGPCSSSRSIPLEYLWDAGIALGRHTGSRTAAGSQPHKYNRALIHPDIHRGLLTRAAAQISATTSNNNALQWP